jgi:hypothetical protein
VIEDRIDGVLIEQEEDGFWLILSGEQAEYRFSVQGVARELLSAVKREIEPWWAEGLAALRTMPREDEAEDGAYELHDPKHPRYHEAHS